MKTLVPFDSLPDTLTFREKIAYLAASFTPIASPKMPIVHTFDGEWYVRTMTVPADTVFFGREHICGHQITLTEGSVLWIKPEGKVRIDAPYTHHSSPGDFMVIATLTPITCFSVHHNPTATTDIDALEAQYFAPADEFLALGRRVAGLLA